jgi:hypothetical protein
MHRDCNLAILGNLVQKRISPQKWNHYCKMLARGFSEVLIESIVLNFNLIIHPIISLSHFMQKFINS